MNENTKNKYLLWTKQIMEQKILQKYFLQRKFKGPFILTPKLHTPIWLDWYVYGTRFICMCFSFSHCIEIPWRGRLIYKLASCPFQGNGSNTTRLLFLHLLILGGGGYFEVRRDRAGLSAALDMSGSFLLPMHLIIVGRLHKLPQEKNYNARYFPPWLS